MGRNVGVLDRRLRFAAAAVLAALYFFDVVRGTAGLVLLILSGVLFLTGFARFCLLYLPFGLRTRREEEAPCCTR